MYKLILVAFCAILTAVEAQPPCTPSQTPMDIQERFLRDCTGETLSEMTCQNAWMAFANAFQSQDPANVMASDYAPYFNNIPIEVGEDQSLFWSGTSDLVGLISCMMESGISVVSSTNTPSSRIINGFGTDINWCGTMGGSIDYETLCPCNPVTQFWHQFSTVFAQAARGTIFYIGNGERSGGTYDQQRFFGMVEIPNLDRNVVTSAVVIVVHRQGQGESCGEGTVATLENTLRMDFDYTCYDVYGDLNDSTQIDALSDCASMIIGAEQRGNEPEANSCFSKQQSGTTGLTSARSGLLLLATLFLSLVFCLNCNT